MTNQDKQLLDELIKWFEAPDHTKTFTFRRKTRELLEQYRAREKATDQLPIVPLPNCPNCSSPNPIIRLRSDVHLNSFKCEDQWHNR